jgi:predicted Zn-ribbon and HTH transcriptional regulator
MFRRELIAVLLDKPWRISELARELRVPRREILEDLRHVARSLKKSEYLFHMVPATCRQCGFAFSPDKIAKPGKCPQCRSTWIVEPVVQVLRRQAS